MQVRSVVCAAVCLAGCGAISPEFSDKSSVRSLAPSLGQDHENSSLPLGMCGRVFRDADSGVAILRGSLFNHVVIAGTAAAARDLELITTTSVSKCIFFSKENWAQGDFIVVDSIANGPVKGGIIISN